MVHQIPMAWASLLLLAACGDTLRPQLRVVDEDGEPVVDAAIRWPGGEQRTNTRGRAALPDLEHPVMAVISAGGFLDEPVALGRSEEQVRVRLWRDEDRLAMHFGGDVMLGRRYLDPDEGQPLVVTGDGGDSARAVVAELAPAFSAADLSMVNLETVVGDFDDEQAYPGKRWILLTPPDALGAVEALGADVVVLGNNHQRDFLEAGVLATLDALDERGLPWLGAGLSAEEATQPLVVDHDGLRVGVLSWTSVDGSWVNEAYPRDDDPLPDDLDPDEAWQWEARTWGWTGTDEAIPEAERRIGSAWDALLDLEPHLDGAEVESLWASLEAVYPEMQDWVAQRGHGGAAAWDQDRGIEAIQALSQEVDLLVVHLHSGYQYASAPSPRLRQAAHDAVLYGADLVVAHHPHVLQGAEFYAGRLVTWSLGNLVFDQDFLVTFPSAFLRTVWQGDDLLEARLIPIALEGYRPVPVVDRAARDVLGGFWEDSLADATARRGSDLMVRNILPGDAPFLHQPVRVRWSTNSAVLEPGRASSQSTRIRLEPEERARLDVDGLVSAPAGVELGRSLFGWGDFEDGDTDAVADDATHWDLDGPEQLVSHRVWEGRACLHMERSTASEQDLVVRPVARIPLREHRWWLDESTPADGAASWSVHLAVRNTGEPDLASVRVIYYHFDDANPTAAPTSARIRQVDYPIEVASGHGWRELWIDLPPADMAPDGHGREVNALMPYVVMRPAAERRTEMCVDEFDVVEWRAAEPTWAHRQWVRASDWGAIELDVLTW